MTDLSEQLKQFQRQHPIIFLLSGGAAVVVAKKEYDRRYHSKGSRSAEDKEDGE